MKIYDVAIIGCGNVAGLYGSNTNTNLQTHASAYNQCEKTRIIAAVDPNIEQLDNFSKKWSIEHTFKDIDEMFQNVSPDIISICSPTDSHYENLKHVSSHPISGVFMEKPLSDNLNESKELAHLDINIPVTVNYFRRWNDDLKELKNELNNNKFGDVKKITTHYTKGLVNNASHILDLLLWYFEDVSFENVILRYPKTDDDYGIDCRLFVDEKVPVYLLHIPEVDYVFIEIEIICENAVVKISQRGQKIQIFKKERDPDYAIFNRINLNSDDETRWNSCFLNAINELVSSIETGSNISCSMEDAFKVSYLCDEILNSRIR